MLYYISLFLIVAIVYIFVLKKRKKNLMSQRSVSHICKPTVETNNLSDPTYRTIIQEMSDLISKGNVDSDRFRELAKMYSERQPKKETHEEKLAKFGLTPELVKEMEKASNAKHYRNGKFICDRSSPSGSVDNPIVVGIPEYSNTLYFLVEKGCWVLTDGLGNGVIR
ncbi:MAG: hypothetical protein ACI4V7_01830 [Succinivibrionaceae bacterium]